MKARAEAEANAGKKGKFSDDGAPQPSPDQWAHLRERVAAFNLPDVKV